MRGVRVRDGISKLRRVIMHRPGAEARDYATSSFEQIFYLRASYGRSSFDYERADEEYDRLLAILEREGVEVLMLEDLLSETLASSPEVRGRFIEDFLRDCGAIGEELIEAARSHLERIADPDELVRRIICGLRYKDIGFDRFFPTALASALDSGYEPDTLLSGPLNTMYFTRDPVTVIGEGAALCRMYWSDRAREGLLYRTVFSHHPDFSGMPFWYSNNSSYHIEGGDILTLGNKSVALGISDRTEPLAIDLLAARLLWSPASNIERAWAVRIPSHGRQLHFDTYLSRIDHDTFIVDPALTRAFEAYRITRGANPGQTRIAPEPTLEGMLCAALDLDGVKLVMSGGMNTLSAARETENNTPSVLCLAPGRLCVPAGNSATCELLAQAGAEIIEAEIGELAYGFGGPDCLCLPIWREA